MKAYKGFNKDMTCRGFQYEEGKTYHEDEAELCASGFHACLNPMDCFSYYEPANSVYHEVELDDVCDEKNNDSKICGKTIKIGAKLSIAKIAKLSVDFVKSKCEKNNSIKGYGSVNTSEGNWSVNTSEGNWSVNTSEGNGSVNISEGDGSVNTSEGNWSVNTSEGDWSVNTSQGYRSVNTSQGNWSVNTSEGDWSVNVSMGAESKNIASKGSLSVGWGKDNKCKGALGSYILLVERGEWYGHGYEQIGEPKLGKIDGETLKPDTWYTLKNGEFVEVSEID